METEESKKDAAEVLVALKQEADSYYLSKDYVKAAEVYEKCLQLVPSSNNAWKREFMENLSRSCLHLGNAEKALEWSLKLHESSCSGDEENVSLNLLATVCHELGKYKEELEALHCCLQRHKSCPKFWLRLGLCYAGLFKIDLPGSSLQKANTENAEPCCAFNSKSASQSSRQPGNSEPSCTLEGAVASSSSSDSTGDSSSHEKEEITVKCEFCTLGVQIVSSCFIHTRALLSSGESNLDQERSESIEEEIATSLKYMEVDQSFIDVASTMLGPDFLSSSMQDNLLQEQDNSDAEHPERILDKLKIEE